MSFLFFLMIRRPPRSTLDRSSAASDVYKRQVLDWASRRVLAWRLSNTLTTRKLPRQGDTAKGELRASDVGPVTRQSLTRADDFFDVLFGLTLVEKLIRGQVPE